MTKIKMLNDRIIFDGHADTRQECETITLLCDNLAQSKDFKTIRYESGYAEFEKVGKTDELKFVPAINDVTVVFDSHITKVENTYGSVTTSGNTLRTSDAINPETFNVTLEDGYVIDTVVLDNGDAEAEGSLGSIGETSFTVYPGYGAIAGTITITSKIPAAKQTIDVSELSGWANLATGNHQITIKTKASGYVDSAASNAVTVSKAASGHTLHLVREEGLGPDPRFVISYNGENEFEVPDDTQDYVIENVTTINSLTVTIEMAPGYMGTIVSSELGISVPYDSTSAQSFPVITTATQLTQDTTITISTAASGETWVLNGMPNVIPSFDYYVSFESDGNRYQAISASGSGPMAALYYGNTKVYSGMDGWVSTVYQTITFGTSPSGDLLTWLQENAVKQ